MVLRFTAHDVGADEEEDYETLTAGVADVQDDTGHVLMFMCGLYEPDDQDRAQGMDTYCVVTADQGTAYGGVKALTLRDRTLRVSLDPDNLEALGLEDAEIEVTLDASPEDIARFREALGRILTYGNPKERPAVLEL